MRFTDDRIDFPVSYPAATLDQDGTILNALSANQLSLEAFASVTFSALLLAAQMDMKIASGGFVRVDMLVNPLVAYGALSGLFKPSGNLLWAPLEPE